MELALWVIAAILFIRFFDYVWMALVMLFMIAVPLTALAGVAVWGVWLFNH